METSLMSNIVGSSFQCEDFTCELVDILVTFQFLKMDHSLYVWIGQALNPKMNDLAMAIPTAYESVPAATHLLGSSESINMAKRLSKKLSIPIFVSYNLKTEDRIILPAVEKKLMDELKERSHLLS